MTPGPSKNPAVWTSNPAPWWRCLHCGWDRFEEHVFTGHMKGVPMVHCAACNALHSPPDPDSKTALRWRVEELTAALEPFALLYGEDDDDFPDNEPVIVCFGRTTDYSLALADIRIAVRAFHDASAIDARQRPDPAEGLDPKGESAVANGETPNLPTEPPAE